MSEAIRQFINSIPDKRAALQLMNALDRMLPTGSDTGLTAYATGGQTNAKVLKSTCAFHNVTTVATAADSVALPAAKIGQAHFVKNSATTNAMQVFAPTPDTIDSVATGTGVSQLAGDAVLYFCVADGNYLRFGGVQATEAFGAITATSLKTSAGFAAFGATLTTAQHAAITTAALPTLTTTQLTGLTTTEVAALNTDLAAFMTTVDILKTHGFSA